jgi:hypothetical protein
MKYRQRRRRRGLKEQERKRDMERSIKIDVLAFMNWAQGHGRTLQDSAEQLGLRRSAVSRWRRRWRQDRLQIRPRGRPLDDASRDTRQVILALFNLMGPGVGLPTLRAFFPDESKGYLADLLLRYRRAHLWKNKTVVHALRWLKPGTVWAIDFLDAPAPVDGLYRYVFAVRDLASGNMLLALPAVSKEMNVACDALAALFKQHRAPLVIKSDCGFDAWKVKTLMKQNSVTHLLSPPHFPRYNGAIEAGIGSLKTRAHYQSARRGTPGEWNCDDVEAARLQANETARPWGHDAPAPESHWIERNCISSNERFAFIAAVEAAKRESENDMALNNERSINRIAVTRALVAHGLLSVRRSRITLPIKSVFRSKIK